MRTAIKTTDSIRLRELDDRQGFAVGNLALNMDFFSGCRNLDKMLTLIAAAKIYQSTGVSNNHIL